MSTSRMWLCFHRCGSITFSQVQSCAGDRHGFPLSRIHSGTGALGSRVWSCSLHPNCRASECWFAGLKVAVPASAQGLRYVSPRTCSQSPHAFGIRLYRADPFGSILISFHSRLAAFSFFGAFYCHAEFVFSIPRDSRTNTHTTQGRGETRAIVRSKFLEVVVSSHFLGEDIY